MNRIKMLGLAVIATGALLGLIGVGSASAELCSTNTSPCTGTVYPNGTTLHMTLKAGSKVDLNTNLGTLTCTSGTIKGKTTSHIFHKDTVDIESLVNASCTLGGSACTVTATGLSTESEINATGGGNGTMTIGSMGMKWECGVFLNCTFTAPKGLLSFTGGNPANVTAKEVEMSRSGGFCPSSAKWNAEYEVTSPKPVFEI